MPEVFLTYTRISGDVEDSGEVLHVSMSVRFVSVASHDQVAAANGEASTAAAETPAAEVHLTCHMPHR